MRRRWPVICILPLFLGAGMLWAQTTSGSIVGTVRDPGGRVIPAATVTATNAGTGLRREVRTAANGFFQIVAVPAGHYRVTATAAGFATVAAPVQVTVGQTQTLDLKLPLAGTATTVTVEAGADLVNTTTSQLGGVVRRAQVETLPLNGRNFTQLALLNPGVAAFGGGGGNQGADSSGFSSNGQRSTSNNFLVDGIQNDDYIGSGVAQIPSIDSIQEFQVQTNNFSAQYGRNSGTIVNLITKSGTNQFHGSLYEFFRNDALDAENFFADPSLPKPQLRLNQFGATIGGPIHKNKTFFFANYEGFRQQAGITELTNVPTLAERAGTFTGANGQPFTVPVNPTSAALFKLFPLPNTSVPGGNFISSPNLTNDSNQYLIKIDQQLNDTDRLSGRYSYTGANFVSPFASGQEGTTIPGYGDTTTASSQLVALSYTKVLSPSTVNQARLGFTRLTGLTVNDKTDPYSQFGFNLGWPADSPYNLANMPEISFAGGLVSGGGSYSSLGPNNNNPGGAAQNSLEFVDDFSHTTARHNLMFGTEITNDRINDFYDLDFDGQVVFTGDANPYGVPNPLIDFAMGLPSSALSFIGNSARSFRTTNYAFFAQDSFQLTPSFTVNYGLRYELDTVLSDASGQGVTWLPQDYTTYLSPSASQQDLAALEASGVRLARNGTPMYEPNHKNFAPRFGVAWNLGGAHPLVLRAGYGIFYDLMLGNVPTNGLLNPPFMPGFFNASPGWPDAFAEAGFPVLTVTAPHMPTPYAQSWNVDVQKGLGGATVLELSYVGTKGTDLTRIVQIDQPYNQVAQINALTPSLGERLALMGLPPGAIAFLTANPQLAPTIARNPYFGFAKLFQAQNASNSIYNSFQARLQRQLARGLSFEVAYTYAKSIDDASDVYGSGANGTTIFPQNNYDLDAERGLSDFDIRSRLVANYIYQVPRWSRALPNWLASGWELSGIVTLQTGMPLTVLTGNDNSSTGIGSDRPNLVGNPNDGPKTVAQWFNVAAFVPNAPFTFGNAGRNIVEGPGYEDWDLGVMKNIPWGEGRRVQLRAEFFNVLNHPNFALPQNIQNAPNFGALYQTPDVAQGTVGLGSGGPRLIQLAAKLIF